MILWHNPRCSKSRQTLALLEEAGVTPDIRLYLKDNPSEDELRAVCALLGQSTREMMRKGESTYKELGLTEASDDALFAAMAAHPILIERPIAITKEAARIGRPPENVLGLIKAD